MGYRPRLHAYAPPGQSEAMPSKELGRAGAGVTTTPNGPGAYLRAGDNAPEGGRARKPTGQEPSNQQ